METKELQNLGEIIQTKENLKLNKKKDELNEKHLRDIKILKDLTEELIDSDFAQAKQKTGETLEKLYKNKHLERHQGWLRQKRTLEDVAFYVWNLYLNKMEFHEKKLKEIQESQESQEIK